MTFVRSPSREPCPPASSIAIICFLLMISITPCHIYSGDYIYYTRNLINFPYAGEIFFLFFAHNGHSRRPEADFRRCAKRNAPGTPHQTSEFPHLLP